MATKQRNKLTYIASARASFVLQDIDALKKDYEVTPVFFDGRLKILVPFKLVRLFLELLFQHSQVYLISFGGYHSFIATLVARIKHRRSYIILNGTDSVAIPEFNYGHLRGGLLRWCCKKSYQWATKLLPVSESLISTTNDYAFDSKMLGLKVVFPSMHLNYQIIPNGFDLDFWKHTSSAKPKSIVTVATLNRIAHKGVDLLLKIAKVLDDFTFTIVGIDSIDGCPENVKCLGYMSPQELKEVYSENKYYLQLSVWEGFGCALCEAMLSGCIPIVSNVNFLPEIVGDDRLVLKKRTHEDLLGHLRDIEAFEFEEGYFTKLVEDRFSLAHRMDLLRKEILA